MYDILFTEIPDEVVIPAILGIFGLLVMDSFFLKTPFFSHFLSFDTYYSILNIPIVNALLGSITIFLFFLLQIWLSDGKWMG